MLSQYSQPCHPISLLSQISFAWSSLRLGNISFLLIIAIVCITQVQSFPADISGKSTSSSATRVHFPSRDRRIPENQWRHRLSSVTASIVFPSPTTTDPTTTDTVIEDDIGSSMQYRDSILTPPVDAEGRPNCTSQKSDTYCEDIPEYPRLDIEREIRMTKDQFREVFGSSVIDGRKSYSDDDSNEVRVCRRTEKLVFPKLAKNQLNQWIYIVNDVDYSQAIISELCESEDKPCAYLEDHSAFSSHCRQKYSYKKLMAIHPTEKRTYMDTFRFPSCCACYITVPVGLQARKRLV